MKRTLKRLLPGAIVAGELLAILCWERQRPLRRTTEDKFARDMRNVAVAAFAAIPVMCVEGPLALRLARLATARRWGILNRLRAPQPMKTLLALLLMDYTMYAWHALSHRAPVLWRFHIVHHIDRDLDATTALRFHFGEMTLSIVWRALQLATLGVSPAAYTLWQSLLVLSIVFHHANIELPTGLERRLGWLIVTPRLHGIHHADEPKLASANWSSGLSCWDRLHGTFRDDVAQESLRIGLPAYRHERDAALHTLLALPFAAQRDAWLPANGTSRAKSG